MELISFLEAHRELCFGFVTKTVFITHQCFFGYCCAVLAQHWGFLFFLLSFPWHKKLPSIASDLPGLELSYLFPGLCKLWSLHSHSDQSGTHSSVYSWWFPVPTPLKWFLFRGIFLDAHISPQYPYAVPPCCPPFVEQALVGHFFPGCQSVSPHLCFDRSSLQW